LNWQHVEVPVPVPSKDQVLVKVEAASVNPVDWKVQAGGMKLFGIPGKLPYIPGTNDYFIGRMDQLLL
jgi:NADPH:quinone reductase-like Zn-dependent oxidoreductase